MNSTLLHCLFEFRFYLFMAIIGAFVNYYMSFKNFKMPFSEYENGMSKCYP